MADGAADEQETEDGARGDAGAGDTPGGDSVRQRFNGEVSRGEKLLCSGADPESYITQDTLVYGDKLPLSLFHPRRIMH